MNTDDQNNADTDATNDDNNGAQTPASDAVASVNADLARLAADAARAEFNDMKSDMFAKLEALTSRLDDMTKPVPVTDPRKPNNVPPSPDYAALTPASRIAAGYKS